MKNSAGKGGGARKIGRNKVKCAKYKALGIREKNKKRNIKKTKLIIEKQRARHEAQRIRRSEELSRTQERSQPQV